MTKQIPRKIPPSPPDLPFDWTIFEAIEPKSGSVIGQDFWVNTGHGESNESVDIAFQLALDDLFSHDEDWVNGLIHPNLTYLKEEDGPTQIVSVGADAERYEITLDEDVTEELWPFIEEVSITWLRTITDKMHPWELSIIAPGGEYTLPEDAFEWSFPAPSDFTQKFTFEVHNNYRKPYYLDDLDDVGIRAIQMGPHATVTFAQFYSQEEYENTFDYFDDSDALAELAEDGRAPISSPVVPLIRNEGE